jgi:MbtH protein
VESNSATAPGTDESFVVVINREGQYSVWWQDRDVPAGWRPTGQRGTRPECLAHIDSVWTDMRPSSLRDHLEGSPA